MSDFPQSFSDRHGYQAEEAEITIREDAPPDVRAGIITLGYAAGLTPNGMRRAVCDVLLKRPDIEHNWGQSNIEQEVNSLVDDAPWFRIYDIAEKLYAVLREADYSGTNSGEYERRLNQFFRETGVGWQMEEGRVVVRGSEAFTLATQEAVAAMQAAGKPTAANEIHEALQDISRRPDADVTGAIQHAMAALECVARDYTGSKETLGPIIKKLPLPRPLDQAVPMLWGFASEQGRHLMEGRDPMFQEAELVVTVASALSVYLLRYLPSDQS
jgi:hypothetical protein